MIAAWARGAVELAIYTTIGAFAGGMLGYALAQATRMMGWM